MFGDVCSGACRPGLKVPCVWAGGPWTLADGYGLAQVGVHRAGCSEVVVGWARAPSLWRV